MKNNILFLVSVFLCLTIQGFAQTDTVFTTYGIGTEPMEPQQVYSERDRLLGIHVPARWMAYVALQPDQTSGSLIYFENIFPKPTNFIIGGEYKLGKSFSLATSYHIAPSTNGLNNTYHRFLLEQRWYFQKRKLIKHGKSANNLCGSYLSLQEGFNYAKHNKDLNFIHKRQIRLGGGVQYRVKKHSFFDIGAGLAYFRFPVEKEESVNSSVPYVTIDQWFKVGLAMFERNKNGNFSGNFCSVLHCMDEDRNMLKLNLLNALSFSAFLDKNAKSVFMTISPEVAYEQKIGKLPFSVQAGIKPVFTYLYSGNDRQSSIIGLVNNNEIHWFYNQAKRIATGRSGNNLSGPYIALTGGYSLLHGSSKWIGIFSQWTYKSYAGGAVWGYQQRLLNRGYLQFDAGIGYVRYVAPDNVYKPTDGLRVISNMKAGIAF